MGSGHTDRPPRRIALWWRLRGLLVYCHGMEVAPLAEPDLDVVLGMCPTSPGGSALRRLWRQRLDHTFRRLNLYKFLLCSVADGQSNRAFALVPNRRHNSNRNRDHCLYNAWYYQYKECTTRETG